MRKLRIREQIAAEIRRRIAGGIYAPGTDMPTERELAREFETSRTTVSLALASIRESGLIAMAPGRGTRVLAFSERPALGTVGIFYAVKPPFSYKPAQMIDPMEEILKRHQHDIQFVFGPERSSRMTIDEASRTFAGALFIEGLGYEGLMQEMAERRFPFVVANLEKDFDYSCTWVDHRKTTRTAVGLLAALGHRRIALLTRPREKFFYGKAFAGYQAGLEDAGIPLDMARVLVVESVDSPVDSVGAYLKTKELIQTHPEITAIVACRDYLAGGACRAITEAGLTVGRDISVIGFDDTTWPQEPPSLTTFMEPMEALGRIAAEMLIQQLTTGVGSADKREIRAPLILRRSVGPCSGPAPEAPFRFLLQPWEAP